MDSKHHLNKTDEPPIMKPRKQTARKKMESSEKTKKDIKKRKLSGGTDD